MEQYISLSGLATQPSIYDAPDGQFAHLINMIPEDGALRPVSVDADWATELPNTSCELLYVHNGNGYRNLIVFCTNPDAQQVLHPQFYFIKSDPSTPRLDGNCESEVAITGIPSSFRANSIASIGNILVLLGETETLYFFWNGSSYDNVSDFSYDIGVTTIRKFTALGGNWGGSSDTSPGGITASLEDTPVTVTQSVVSDNESRLMYNSLIAKLNSLIAEEDSKHIFRGTSFGVVALELYDGSYFVISDPFILAPDIRDKLDSCTVVAKDGTISSIAAYMSTAKYQINVHMQMSASLRKIINGAVVFVSKPIETWDVDVPHNIGSQLPGDPGGGAHYYGFAYSKLSESKIYDSFDNLSFFRSVYIKPDDLNNNTSIMLENVTGAEEHLSLADFRRSRMAAQLSYVYNNRLHIAGTTEYYTDVNKVQTSYTLPYYQDTMSNYQVWFLSHTNISVPQDSINAGYATLPTADFKAIVSFNDNTQKYLEGSCPWPLPPLLCFPDRNATEIELYVKLGSNYYHITKTLRQSASFDMAYSLKLDTSREFTFFENSDQDIQITETDYEHVEDDWLQEHANDKPVVNNNLLRYSEAVNPFVFPVNNYVPVGVSRITALATSTQPISEGQFGVAPLYVFTDEAVWALSVGNDGTYEARQPASRDVCSNPSAITPIDNAVVFPTERGLMLIAGGKSVCISEALRGSNIEGFDATPAYNQARAFLALAKDIIMVPGEEANTWVEGETDAFTYHDIERGFFDAFLQRAGIFYDYQNQRLVIFNKTSSTNLAYVYSLRSQQWGTAKTDIKAVTNSYPIPFASYTRTWENVTKKYVGWAIASSSEAVEANVFGCTRAMKFDAPMSFKTIRAAILKGDMSNTIKTALFASNDLRHWTLVNSSTTTKLRNKHGNPWRFYRLAFIGSLEGYFCIDGILVDYDVRWNNQIR